MTVIAIIEAIAVLARIVARSAHVNCLERSRVQFPAKPKKELLDEIKGVRNISIRDPKNIKFATD